MKRNCYIDGNNLYRAAKELGFKIDYKRFRNWLRQKYNVTNVYLFIGLVPERSKFYQYLQECGYILVFKQTVSVGGVIKGNCDAELVLNVVTDFYTDTYNDCIIVTGDGDFGCLVEFLKEKEKLHLVLAPDREKFSFLIRNKYVEVTFLNDVYHKFSEKVR
jgi:uncharacterized LabA/DUF88 family protein